MIISLLLFSLLWKTSLSSEVYYYQPYNVTRSTLSGIAEYRSALTLDWLVAEDHRQRELVAAFENEASTPGRVVASECISYAKPASGKVARLMLEFLKNLEGDEGILITELIQSLIRAKLLVETSMLDAEPDLEALVKTPGVMAGEPHTTFPRILAMVWMVACDPTTIKKHGWCPITKVTKYLTISKPANVAKHMRSLDSILARARFIMEEFIQHVTPINVYDTNVNKEDNDMKFGKKKSPKPMRPTRTSLPYKKHFRTTMSIIENPIERMAAYDPSRTPEAVIAARQPPNLMPYEVRLLEERQQMLMTTTTTSTPAPVVPDSAAIKSFNTVILFNTFFIYYIF